MDVDTIKQLSAGLRDVINANSANDAVASQSWRWHLGISIIGGECIRATWYSFRWFTPPNVDGRLARLFQRGHDEEHRINALLRRAGWLVSEHDPLTGKQWLYSAVHGHYGGSCDGILSSVNEQQWPIEVPLLLEMKTHNTKSFTNLVANGVCAGKPQHYAQMCGYGYGLKLDYALYFAVNKNDDDIHVELTKLDHEKARQLELRAESIILAPVPPPKIAKQPSDYRCKMCDHQDVCHYGVVPPVHCRSCAHSSPADAGEWLCKHYGLVIPRDVVARGCPEYESIAV